VKGLAAPATPPVNPTTPIDPANSAAATKRFDLIFTVAEYTSIEESGTRTMDIRKKAKGLFRKQASSESKPILSLLASAFAL
jgi:hypothetical protein